MKTYRLYLNGEWIETAASISITNPATAKTFARICTLDRGRVAQALKDAHAAFISWRQLTGKTRGEFLQKIAAQLDGRRDEVARLITAENGKPLAQSAAEVAMSVDHLRWFAEEARRSYGRII